MRQEIESAIAKACKDLFNAELSPELSWPDEQFGDYATNAALVLGKQLNKNPRELADRLAEELRTALKDTVRDVSVAGPGFINLTLSDQALMAAADGAADLSFYDGQKIVIETNNPNPFKDLHIGHAYNSIVADTIANLLLAGGGEVHRVSYHGDVGLHVGKSMWAILNHINNDPGQLDAVPDAERPTFLSRMYAEGAIAYEQDDLAKQQIEVYADRSFTLDEPVFEQVYEICKQWSFDYFDQVFKSIGSQPIEKRYLERETDQAGREIVEAHIGPVFERSQGAVVFPAERFDLHTRVFINSRGNTLYEARDLGLMRLKEADFDPDLSYIVTANEQKEYFKVVFKAAELAMPDLKSRTANLSTGMVKLSTGKMSSRTGNVVNIGWLLDEITQAVRRRTDDEATVGDSLVGALRYTMLKVRVGGDVIFDVNEAISLDGNSGPYLQYAHARARSILARADDRIQAAANTGLEADERSLLRKISQYDEAVERAIKELMPHHICTYLYELAQDFNRFYERNRVINDPRENTRLRLIRSYADTLRSGLELLGIPAPDRM